MDDSRGSSDAAKPPNPVQQLDHHTQQDHADQYERSIESRRAYLASLPLPSEIRQGIQQGNEEFMNWVREIQRADQHDPPRPNQALQDLLRAQRSAALLSTTLQNAPQTLSFEQADLEAQSSVSPSPTTLQNTSPTSSVDRAELRARWATLPLPTTLQNATYTEERATLRAQRAGLPLPTTLQNLAQEALTGDRAALRAQRAEAAAIPHTFLQSLAQEVVTRLRAAQQTTQPLQPTPPNVPHVRIYLYMHTEPRSRRANT